MHNGASRRRTRNACFPARCAESINATFKNSPAISFNLLAFLNSFFFFNTSPVALPVTYRRADTQTLSKKRHKIECRSSQLDYYALIKT